MNIEDLSGVGILPYLSVRDIRTFTYTSELEVNSNGDFEIAPADMHLTAAYRIACPFCNERPTRIADFEYNVIFTFSDTLNITSEISKLPGVIANILDSHEERKACQGCIVNGVLLRRDSPVSSQEDIQASYDSVPDSLLRRF